MRWGFVPKPSSLPQNDSAGIAANLIPAQQKVEGGNEDWTEGAAASEGQG